MSIVDDGVPLDVIAAIDDLPEAGPSLVLYRAVARSGELGDAEVVGFDLNVFGEMARVDGEGSLADVAAGDAVLDHTTASAHGVSVGDAIDVNGRTLRIGYVLSENSAIFEGVAVAPAAFREMYPDLERPEQLAVDVATGVDTASTLAVFEAIEEANPEINVFGNLERKDELNRQLDRVIAAVVAILALAVVIAAIGMANTLSLAVHERTPEIGLLRALGVTSGGIRSIFSIEAVLSSFSIEAVLSSLAAGLSGVVIGVVYAWAAVRSIPNLVFVVPWFWLGACLLVAIALGVIASLAPARRAARVSPVVALAAG